MIKIYKKNIIIPFLLQILKKQKLIGTLTAKKTKTNVCILQFLWLHKIIFGYTIKQEKDILIYLKYNKMTNLLFLKCNLYKGSKSFQKMRKECPNTFFIIASTNGLLSINKILSYKIGGFLMYKLF